MDGRLIFDRLAALVGDAVSGFEDAVARSPAETGKAPTPAAGPRDACFRARPGSIVEVMRHLRDHPELGFDFLQNLTVVDWIKRDVFEVVYHLFSYRHRHQACVKVEIPRTAPRLPSVTRLWPVANWLEREQFDLLGVVFEGHPDLRRILMPDDWVGHPMRKDFREPRAYRGMPTTRPSPLDLLANHDRAFATKPEPTSKAKSESDA